VRPSFLPDVEGAWIPPEKLRDYVLNPQHPDGRHKARVFASSLGIVQKDWEYLRDQLLAGVGRSPVLATETDVYGTHYEVSSDVLGRNGRTLPVTAAWLVAHEGDRRPRLITVYVGRR